MLAPGTLSVSFTFNLGLDNINGLQSFLRGLPPTVWSGWRLNSPQPSSGKSAHYIQLLRGVLLELIPHHWNLEVFSFSMMEKAVSVLSAMEGVNAGLGWVSVKLFFWLCSRFPLEGIFLCFCISATRPYIKSRLSISFLTEPHWLQEL